MNYTVNIKAFYDIQKECERFGARLVAVSKLQPNDKIIKLYEAGQRIFGENRVQELCNKKPELPGDIEWHFIGHLQTNKVKYIVPFISLIHSVDSGRLLSEINKQAMRFGRVLPCLLQFHIAKEESKYGLSIEEAHQLLNSDEFHNMKNIKICGVMGMATNTNDKIQIEKEFRLLKKIFDELKVSYFENNTQFKEISMGMSNDYLIALHCGSTMIRIGSSLFSL
ncbi:MAG: YggS family pyridoxal phosphate-dependent enzyme [Chitinophagales bacterium]|nr:YggS family pyridoxal phosphate-dependent enzyme [Chitinophagales bacterium]MDW8274123.1 YggS family pyridoxal phosphate-dependent enzyme [Chitinophagales bacterium]